MAAVSLFLGRNLKSRRSFRKRRDSEEENFVIDLNRGTTEILQEILLHVVKQDINKSRKLSYLNGLVKLCNKIEGHNCFGFSYREIFCCLRVSLFHESCEVRAAGLRAFRYLLQNDEALDAFLTIQLPFLVARSLDVLLDNRLERIQALRLMRKVICVNPHKFPRAFTSCLVSVANDGAQERDLVRACLATLAQLSLLNPAAFVEASGLSALLRNVLDCQQPSIAEAMLGAILYLFNNPETRELVKDDFGLEHLLAPFTDCHYRYPNEVADYTVSDDKEAKLAASKLALVSVLRSWPGITYMCKPSHLRLQSLVDMLYLPYSDIRKNIIDLVYEVFGIPVPEWTDDFCIAAHSADPSAAQTSWQLYEGFVVAEGIAILPYASKDRTNLVENYFALLLLVFVHSGVLEALVDVIVTSEIYLAVRSTVLLGELLYMTNQLLPSDCSHRCSCLPSLISAAASFKSPQEQNQASAAISCLYRIHELKKRGPVPYSLALDHLLHLCNPEREKKSFFVGTISRTKLWQYLKKDISDVTDQAIKDTQVLSKEFHSWDWDLIDSILKNPSEALKKIEDTNSRIFIRKLISFYKASSKQFSEMDANRERGQQICITGCHLLEFLLETEESKSHEYLDDFLSDLNDCLSQVTKDNAPLNVVLSPTKVLSTFSHAYFLYIGKFSSTNKGCKLLDKSGTFQNLLHLVGVTTHDTFIKLIVSTLDYSKEGFARTVLSKVLTGTIESSRLYATNYLRVLLRAGLPDFRKWAIEFLVTQLYDESKTVSFAAVDILDEACNIQENLEALISLRPSLLHIGDRGLLLLLRFLSVPSGFRFLRDANFLFHELHRWHKTYNLKYVKIVEDSLNEALTRHRRGEDGTYGRRSSDNRHNVQDVFVPPHMYGQLIQHSDGVELLLNEDCLSDLFALICSPNFSSEIQVLQLKAALWAAGHIGASILGFPLVQNADLIPHIVQLAVEAPVLSVRGTCFYVLGLLSATPEGALTLGQMGWEAIQRTHDEKWPLIKDAFLEDIWFEKRSQTWSVSSTGSEWPLGALPFSLSFMVSAHDHYLCNSPSSNSLNTEDVGSSTLAHSMCTLPRSATLFSNKQNSSEPRPRSSSDCQTDRRESIENENSGAVSWSSLTKDRSSSFSCSRDNEDVDVKERSISSFEVSNGILQTKDERSSSNESSNTSGTKSRSNSSADSATSAVSSSDSKPYLIEQTRALSPIASCTSINTSIKSSADTVLRPTVLRQLSHGHSCRLHSPVSPDGTPVFTFTSARDAHGYVTLKDIQRKRVQSLSFHESHSYAPDADIRSAKSRSLEPWQADAFLLEETKRSLGHTHSNSLRSSLSSEVSDAPVIYSNSNDANVKPTRFIGLCLPTNFSIFCVENISNVKHEDSVDEVILNETQEDQDVGLEFHTVDNCLASHSSHAQTGLLRTSIAEETEESGIIQAGKPIETGHMQSNHANNTILLGDGHNPKGVPKLTEDCPEGKALIRKEVMRCVTNLCSSVAVKASEQGLLNLKQKFPSAFQDICLYTEVSLHMSHYNFRLPARRFLQELFLDIAFDQLLWEAELIVGVINLPQLGGSDV